MKKSDMPAIFGLIGGLLLVGIAKRFVLNRPPRHSRLIKKHLVGYRKMGKVLQMLGNA